MLAARGAAAAYLVVNRMKQNAPVPCGLCNKPMKVHETVPAELIRPGVMDAIRKEHPDWEASGYVCLVDLNKFRGKFVQEVLEDERGQLSQLEEQVVKSLEEQEAISQNINDEFDKDTTFGERIADKVAVFGGSWSFIIFFGVVLVVWIAINSILMTKPFDPAPFIGLNLILSCLAALQAPVIMMSQNRQDAKDRLRADSDFRTNLKAELEIRHLNAKMDILLTHQWQKLLEIQRIQMELMQELAHAKRSSGVKVVAPPPPNIDTERLMQVQVADLPMTGGTDGASLAADGGVADAGGVSAPSDPAAAAAVEPKTDAKRAAKKTRSGNS